LRDKTNNGCSIAYCELHERSIKMQDGKLAAVAIVSPIVLVIVVVALFGLLAPGI